MEPYITLVIGAFIGLAGYFTSTFWIQPIIRYRAIKSRIVGRLTYFSDVYESEDDERLKEMARETNSEDIRDVLKVAKERMKEKKFGCRRLSGELEGILLYLPRWYKFFFLRRRDEKPEQAVKELIGLSNSRDYDQTKIRMNSIKIMLKTPGWKELKPPGTF